MIEKPPFRYHAACGAANCSQAALYKVAAPWSSGSSRELKNYGLTCDAHRESQLTLARAHRDLLKVAEGEVVGPVELYKLTQGKRDVELSWVSG